jgi:hypothetical protein
MDVSAKIKGITYTPFLCPNLETFSIDCLEYALSKYRSFILDINNKQVAVSWWVTPKRTRSYPYARVYDTLSFTGKKVTIIPIYKDEGKDGDRDFLQWDTISLMSLLGIYTIISYYYDAKSSSNYKQKITAQKFDTDHIKDEIYKLLSYQSDALHWNLNQTDKVGEIGKKALAAYEKISERLGVTMHSKEWAEDRILELLKGKENFTTLSRKLAEKAQSREVSTIQPKEHLVPNSKAKLTIDNFLGGKYYFTVDEIHIVKNTLYLIEGKHSKRSLIPSLEDIKDGLVKMMLFTNLKEVKIGDKEYSHIAELKLTSEMKFSKESLNEDQLNQLRLLKQESEKNNFHIVLNDLDLGNIDLTGAIC